MSLDTEAFSSAPIKLAAIIKAAREQQDSAAGRPSRARQGRPVSKMSTIEEQLAACHPNQSSRATKKSRILPLAYSVGALCVLAATLLGRVQCSLHRHHTNQQLISRPSDESGEPSQVRHHAHYLNIVPSTHFSYEEGRQAAGRSLEAAEPDELQAAASSASSSHIYKRSSAALLGAASQHHQNAPLVSSSRATGALNPLSRRMMSSWAQTDAAAHAQRHPPAGWAAEAAAAPGEPHEEPPRASELQQQANSARNSDKLAAADYDAELLKQKQHIQYHDQWPSLAGKCHKRTLNFCASVLPFNTTTFPNIIGDTNRFEVKRSLPFFGFLAKSSCNRRLDELLCLLLEPPCAPHSGLAIPPCKKFCRLALEGCNEYIPATLALSSVFDCRQYPDSNDPGVCVNLAQGSKCSPDEFKCPDKTCIPRNWLCDGVRDCLFAADEANCTATPQASVCSTEEFKCDGKCVPKAWKCDGERDCLDGSDEESCDLRPRCGPDRFRCADGNGCIPKRWVCDGKAECRDGSDETNCEQRDCSENDFKCDNGICIPKLWRCDRQADCRDGSDERHCVYPTPAPPTSTASPTTTTITTSTTQQPARADEESQQQQQQTTTAADSRLVSLNATYGLAGQPSEQQTDAAPLPADDSATNSTAADEPQQQRLGASLANDVSRIIQHESSAAAHKAAAPSKPLDYEMIQSNELQPQPANKNVEFVLAQQQQQQQPPAEQHHQMQPHQQQLAGSRHQPARVPIYRSLFKSFKTTHRGQPARLASGPIASGPAGGPRGPVVAVARRRRNDRHNIAHREQHPFAAAHQAHANEQQQPPPQHQLGNLRDSQVGVTSYLQMLNNRYNLRLAPRVGQNAGAAQQL